MRHVQPRLRDLFRDHGARWTLWLISPPPLPWTADAEGITVTRVSRPAASPAVGLDHPADCQCEDLNQLPPAEPPPASASMGLTVATARRLRRLGRPVRAAGGMGYGQLVRVAFGSGGGVPHCLVARQQLSHRRPPTEQRSRPRQRAPQQPHPIDQPIQRLRGSPVRSSQGDQCPTPRPAPQQPHPHPSHQPAHRMRHHDHLPGTFGLAQPGQMRADHRLPARQLPRCCVGSHTASRPHQHRGLGYVDRYTDPPFRVPPAV